MRFVYLVLTLTGPLGWIAAAILHKSRKKAAEQARLSGRQPVAQGTDFDRFHGRRLKNNI